MLYFIIFIVYIVGILTGTIIVNMVSRGRQQKIGTLRIDTSDPDEKPYMFLELNKGIEVIDTKKKVILDVKMENYIPQK